MSISCVLNRRSVRDFTGESVTEEQLKMMLRAGMYACSARNSQPWEFIVIRQHNLLKRLSEGGPHWQPLQKAPLAIVVAADTRDIPPEVTDMFPQGCAAASQNILTAAAGLELGGVWLGCFPKKERMDFVSDALHMPEGVVPFSILAIGHPANSPQPHDFYIKEKVHWEMY